MTAQIPDELINECPDVDLAGLYLYAVITGDIQSNHGWGMTYPFKHKPRPPGTPVSSANWRGYVASFQLTPDGHLRLISYRYGASALRLHETAAAFAILLPLNESSGPETEEVEEQLVGDFWMVMKEEFFGPRTYISFRNGVIVKDRDQWFNWTPLHWSILA